MKTLPCLQQQRRSLLFLGCLMALTASSRVSRLCLQFKPAWPAWQACHISVKTKGGKFLSWSERAQLSSTCISAFGERCHFGVQTTFQCPLSWCPVVPPYGDGNVWGPTPTFLETFLSGRVHTTPSVLAFAGSTELRCRSAPVGSHVLSVYKDCGEMFGQCFLIFPAEPSDAEFSICSLLAPNVIEGHWKQWVILYHGG